MGSHRRTSRGRTGRRALTTAFCSLLVFAVGFGQAALPANAGGPGLTMGQVSTGNSSSSGGPQTTRQITQHVLAAAAATVAPNHVGINLEGCRNGGSITLPIAGKFICPDAAYTSGNLGKGWNELDLVPHRVTTSSGTQAGTTTDYDFNITADGEDGGHPGYDLLTVPEVNAAKSDASCTVSSSAQGAKTPGIGGTDTSIYRTLHVHQDKGTTCVIDWAERLALGSHLYPGSSLHSNLTQADFSTGGIGAQDVSIPVKEISPQELSKTETATQGAGNVWRVNKQASPSSLDFPRTCNPDNPTSKTVQIDVTVTKTVQQTGNTIVHAEITATNPAHRIVDVTISDSIFEGAIGSSTLATALAGTNPKTFPLTSVNPESSVTLVHEIEVANGSANIYSDKATAKYTDHAFPDVTIPGQTEATAQANVVVNTSNANSSVVVTDLESISGNPDVQYRIDTGSAAGTYKFNDGALETYTPGTTGYTTRPVLWTSGSVSQTTTFHFFKTVRVAKPTSGDATLADTATVLGDQGATLSTADASVAISTDLNCPDVVVTKTAPKDTIDAGDTASFTITVTNNGPGIAKNVTLNDPLPAGIAWQDDSADCSITNGTLSCQFGDLDPGESRTVHVSGTTDAARLRGSAQHRDGVGLERAAGEPGEQHRQRRHHRAVPQPQHHEDRRRSVRERGRHGRLHDHRDEQRPRHGQERRRERHAADERWPELVDRRWHGCAGLLDHQRRPHLHLPVDRTRCLGDGPSDLADDRRDLRRGRELGERDQLERREPVHGTGHDHGRLPRRPGRQDRRQRDDQRGRHRRVHDRGHEQRPGRRQARHPDRHAARPVWTGSRTTPTARSPPAC